MSLKRRRRRSSRRRDRDTERSTPARVRILEGAATAFGRHGYADTRVEDILEAADVSRPTFYKAFANKDAVFNALADASLLSLVTAVKAAATACDTADRKLDAALDAYLRWVVSNGVFGRVLATQSYRPGTYASEQRRGAIAAITAFFRSEVERAAHEVDPLLLEGLIAAMERVAASLLSEKRIDEPAIERRKLVMLQLMYGTLAAPNTMAELRREAASWVESLDR